jgi:membrane protease YdiL (CAAX protease family)
VRSAGEILRPAIVLWILIELIYGVASIGLLFCDAEKASSLWSTYQRLWVGAQFLVALVTLTFVWCEPEARRVFGKVPSGAGAFCFVVAVVSCLFFAVWYRVLGEAGGLVSEFGQAATTAELFWLLLTTALMPALFEEWCYRGFLLHRFRQVMSVPLAIALQAMMFSAMHMNTMETVPHFLYGVVAGAMRVKMRALWPCMLLHLLWNGAWVLMETGRL